MSLNPQKLQVIYVTTDPPSDIPRKSESNILSDAKTKCIFLICGLGCATRNWTFLGMEIERLGAEASDVRGYKLCRHRCV